MKTYEEWLLEAASYYDAAKNPETNQALCIILAQTCLLFAESMKEQRRQAMQEHEFRNCVVNDIIDAFRRGDVIPVVDHEAIVRRTTDKVVEALDKMWKRRATDE